MLCVQVPVDAERLALLPWLKRAAKQLKRSVLALYYATQDPNVGWVPRMIAAFVLAYALSPMDLIPDFIPVLGFIDDLILLPGMIWLVSCPFSWLYVSSGSCLSCFAKHAMLQVCRLLAWNQRCVFWRTYLVLLQHHDHHTSVSIFSSWMQAIRLIPEAVMLRAQQRADEEPLRLNENWVTACCIFLMWNMSAVGTLYLVCTKFGKPWWRRHWWVAAIILVAIMVLAEIVWAACTILLERRTENQSDKQTATDLGVNAPLLVTQDGDDQLTIRVDV